MQFLINIELNVKMYRNVVYKTFHFTCGHFIIYNFY